MNKLVNYGATERYFAEARLYPNMFLARIVSQYSDLYKLVTGEGEGLAEVSGKFRFATTHISDYPAVGDFVMVDRENGDQGHMIIHHVLRRKSAFERMAVGMNDEVQVVATNIDILFLCMALNRDYNLNRLERYLAVAWNSGATPVVVLTKSDLATDLTAILSDVTSIALGVDILTTTTMDMESCRKLLPYFKTGVSASFIGSSGVGKSTLINTLMEKNIIATSHIRQDDKGRHTTTRRELFVLPQGGVVIDTPGMRELGVESTDLGKTFAEITELSALCRFHDCTHTTEPGCAVQEAIANGALDIRRYESYEKLSRETKYDGLSSRQIEAEKINTMFGGKGNMKAVRDYSKHKNKRY